MKKKHVIMLITCFIVVVTGICYSCTYQGLKTSTPVITTLSQDEEEGSTEEDYEVRTDTSTATPDNLNELFVSGKSEELAGTDVSANSADTDKEYIYVHLCGAIEEPEVYKVVKGTRLVELITLAGGLTKEAAGDYINQAVLVEDGQRIYIPTKDEVEEINTQEYINSGIIEGASEAGALININLADADTLMTLPGIGQAKANSIIEYRSIQGDFKSIEELMNIPGIKEGLFSQISSRITVK